MNKRERKILTSYFRTYEINKKISKSAVISSALDGVGVDYSKISVDSSKGNASENKVINAIEKADIARRKVEVVDKTVIACRYHLWYNQEYMEIIDNCLFRRCNEAAYYGTNGFAERTFKRRKQEIIDIAYGIAVELHLMRKEEVQ